MDFVPRVGIQKSNALTSAKTDVFARNCEPDSEQPQRKLSRRGSFIRSINLGCWKDVAHLQIAPVGAVRLRYWQEISRDQPPGVEADDAHGFRILPSSRSWMTVSRSVASLPAPRHACPMPADA